MEKNKTEEKKVHFNVPQLIYFLVQASLTVCIWARATGKTEGPGAMFSMTNMDKMPRSLGSIVSTTYDKLLTLILPGLVKGWEKFGYLENIHFFIRKYAPVNYFQAKPFREPKKPDHYIPWWNGSGAVMVSLDRPSTTVAASVDWQYIDEGRFIKKETAFNAMLTVRGNAERFGQLSNHGSILITSDRPKDSKGSWILEYADLMDEEVVNMILGLQSKLIEIEEGYEELTKTGKAKADGEIAELNDIINKLRRNLVHVSYATTFDNIEALGMDTLKGFKRMLSDLDFQVSVANKKVRSAEKGFYAALGEHHLYDAPDEDFMDNFHPDFLRDTIEKDSRWDKDIDPHQPLDIALDYNNAITSIVVGQSDLLEDRTLNFMYVLHPFQLIDAVKKFDRYYRRGQVSRVVNYYFDHTALQGRNAINDISYKDEVIKELESLGWEVNAYYFGQALTHKSRYYMFGKLFKGTDGHKKQRFNRSNTEVLYNAMKDTGSKQVGETFKKDKDSEKNGSGVAPEDSTHGTEAWDMLATGKNHEAFKHSSQFVETF